MIDVSNKFTFLPHVCVVDVESHMHMLLMCKFVNTTSLWEVASKNIQKGGIAMTGNQIKYQEMQENRRHNLYSEGISKIQADASTAQAAAAASQAESAALNAKSNAQNARSNALNAGTKQREVMVQERKMLSEIYKNYASGTADAVSGAVKVMGLIPLASF